VEIFRPPGATDWVERWSPADAVLLKAVALWLGPVLERVILYSFDIFILVDPLVQRSRAGC
jgi:hypothetical protein